MIRSDLALQEFGTRDILIPAIKLVGYKGIAVVEEMANITYWHVLLDKHEVIFAHGAPAESLLAGAEALKGLSAQAKEEILALFPNLSIPNFKAQPSRQIVERMRFVTNFLELHSDTRTPLL